MKNDCVEIKLIKKTIIITSLIICICLGLAVFASAAKADAKEQTILATTFPIYQIVRQVIKGCDGLKVKLMLSSHLGCPHDYMIRPRDMQKLLKANILVINGLGMEDFLDAFLKKAGSQILVIDSSAGIKETLEYSGRHLAETQDDHNGHGGDGHDHHHANINPHLFVSPRMSAKFALSIAAELSKIDSKAGLIYLNNARAYAKTMNKLADEMADLGKRLKNKRIVQPHGIFDYLARDMGLEIVAVMQSHNQKPSASEMMQLVKIIREKQAGAILSEPQYSGKVAKTLSKETGVPVIMLDPVATGPENAPLNYYETVMRQNMKTIEKCLVHGQD
jgi:zinc transport system substrate-binding protein